DRHPAGPGVGLLPGSERHPPGGLLPAGGARKAARDRLGEADAPRGAQGARDDRAAMGRGYNRGGRVHMSAVPDETIVLRDQFVPHGRTVPTENGWTWIAAAWSIFRRAAGIWIGMVLTLAVIYTVLAVLPVIGAIASFVVGPVFTAGLVLTSRTIEQGGEVQFAQLFGGFKYRFGTLLVVGVLYLAGTAAIVFAVLALTGASLFGLLNATSPEAAMALGGTFLVALLLILALM